MKLEGTDITCGYHGVPVLEHVDICVESGEVVCLLGPNGVGKTTLFKTLLGYLPALGGQVTVDGKDRASFSKREFAHCVSYVPQIHEPPFAYSVLDVVLTGCVARNGLFSSPSRSDYEHADRVLDELGIIHLRDRVYTEISGGEQQMALIARSLMQDSRIFVMDEPTAALDFGNQVNVLSCIRRMARQGYGVLMTTHNPDHAFLCCSRAVLVTRERDVFAGTVDEVVTEENLERAYHVRVKEAKASTDQGSVKTCVPLLD